MYSFDFNEKQIEIKLNKEYIFYTIKGVKNRIYLWSIKGTKENIINRYGYDDSEKIQEKKISIKKRKKQDINDSIKSQMKTKIDEKIKACYTMDKTNVNKPDIFRPMLFKDYNSNKEHFKKKFISKWRYVYSQFKLDGIRCFTKFDKLYSRGLNPITTVEHIKKDFEILYKNCDKSIIFDGEIYIHDSIVTDISGVINADNLSEEKKEFSRKLKFYLFDLYDVNNPKLKFEKRYELLKKIYSEAPELNNIILVENVKIKNDEDLFININKDVKRALKLGYEGTMLKDPDGIYKIPSSKSGPRANNFKNKGTAENDYQIINIEKAEREGDFSIIFTLKINNESFKCNGIGSFDKQMKIYENKEKYINKKWLSVKYYSISKEGKPFHCKPNLNAFSGEYIFLDSPDKRYK